MVRMPWPRPPYAAGIVSPRGPRSPSAAIEWRGNAASLSTVAACSLICASATAITSAMMHCCSSFNRYMGLLRLQGENQFGCEGKRRPEGAHEREPVEHVVEHGANGDNV